MRMVSAFNFGKSLVSYGDKKEALPKASFPIIRVHLLRGVQPGVLSLPIVHGYYEKCDRLKSNPQHYAGDFLAFSYFAYSQVSSGFSFILDLVSRTQVSYW